MVEEGVGEGAGGIEGRQGWRVRGDDAGAGAEHGADGEGEGRAGGIVGLLGAIAGSIVISVFSLLVTPKALMGVFFSIADAHHNSTH